MLTTKHICMLRRAVAAAAVLAALLVMSPAGAATPAAPTLAAATTIHGYGPYFGWERDNGWTYSNNSFSNEIKSLVPPTGTTTVRVTFKTPLLHVAPRKTFFAAIAHITHEGQSDSGLAIVQDAQMCSAKGACGAIIRGGAPGTQMVYEVGGTTVSQTAKSQSFLLKAGPKGFTGVVEWEYVQIQNQPDVTDNVLTITYGPAAGAAR